MTLRLLRSSLLALSAVSVGSGYAAAPPPKMTVAPLNQTLNARPGGRYAVQFSINNGGVLPLPVGISVVDVEQSDTGTALVRTAGTTSRSCAGWLRVAQGVRTVAVGRTETMDVQVFVPQRVEGSYHAALLLKPNTSTGPLKGSGAAINVQFLLPIHVVIQGTTRPALELLSCSMAPAASVMPTSDETQMKQLAGKWAIVSVAKNTGNCLVRARGDLIVSKPNGGLLGRYEVAMGNPEGQPFLPGSQLRFPVLINAPMPEDHYYATLRLSFAGGRGYNALMELRPRIGGDPLKGEAVTSGVERTGLQVALDPDQLIVNAPPGALRTGRLNLTNFEEGPVTMDITVMGCTLDPDGTPVPQTDAPVNWLTVMPLHTTVGAKQMRSLTLRMQAPVEPVDRWAMAQVKSVSTSRKTQGLTSTSTVFVLLRSGAAPVNPETRLQSVIMTQGMDGKPALETEIVNPTARAAAYTSATVSLLDPAKPEMKPYVIEWTKPLVALPGAARKSQFALPAEIKPGAYQATLTLNDAKAANPTAAAWKFNVKLANPATMATEKPAPPKPKGAPGAREKTPAPASKANGKAIGKTPGKVTPKPRGSAPRRKRSPL